MKTDLWKYKISEVEGGRKGKEWEREGGGGERDCSAGQRAFIQCEEMATPSMVDGKVLLYTGGRIKPEASGGVQSRGRK